MHFLQKAFASAENIFITLLQNSNKKINRRILLSAGRNVMWGWENNFLLEPWT